MTLEEVVEKVARAYAAKCWWADLRDLKQEAWVAILEAEATYNPARGARSQYAWSSAVYALRAYTWEMSSPVRAPRKRLPETAGMRRVAVDVLLDMPDPTPSPLEQAHSAKLTSEWLAHVRALVAQGHLADEVTRVLLDGERPSRVAREAGIAPWQLWRATKQARERLEQDPELSSAVKGAL